ncbi:MAG: prepilin-type N-terminal cleavage/methylation domain-containing protein [Candidatus Doudnabacteria bacterium]|nr:prepilin-type N-terminal cleavage/methylation domain-containing protein [Candidatus Doudnabacteria bacterium]
MKNVLSSSVNARKREPAWRVSLAGSGGFTLIELLVVIAIIGLLASIVLVALSSSRARSRDATRLAQIRQISGAIELYFNENNTYPPSTTVLVPSYIGTWPRYPSPVDGAACTTSTYAFSWTPTATAYVMPFCLGTQTGTFAAGVHTLSQLGIQ